MKFSKWWDKSWNPITGCSPVSEGCRNCWAKKMVARFPKLHGISDFGAIRIHPERLGDPFHWKKPRRIFVSILGDLFHYSAPFEFIDEIIKIIYHNPNHIFMILTKRPARMAEYFNGLASAIQGSEAFERMFRAGHYTEEFCHAAMIYRKGYSLPNLWLGVTAETQAAADERIPILLQIPAAKKFISIEPMLSHIDLKIHLWEKNGKYSEWIDWVICGKENGRPAAKVNPMAPWLCKNQGIQNCHECPDFQCGDNITPGIRPMDLDWARDLRNQCKIAGIPFFFKNGELDGKIWNQFPK
jgi:protein gp37